MHVRVHVHPRGARDFPWGVAASFNLFGVRGESEGLAERFPLTRTRSFEGDSIFAERIFDSRWRVKKKKEQRKLERTFMKTSIACKSDCAIKFGIHCDERSV